MGLGNFCNDLDDTSVGNRIKAVLGCAADERGEGTVNREHLSDPKYNPIQRPADASGEPPQSAREWLSDHLWRDKDKNEKIPVGEALMMPDNYPVLTTVGRFSESLDAYASECVKRERERCAGIARGEFLLPIENWMGTKKKLTEHLAEAIAAAIERGEG